MSPQSLIQARTLYEQVKGELIRRVVTKEWKPNELLKNEAELAREMQVSLGTVRKAFDSLTEMQLFVRIAGKGTTVVDQTTLKKSHRFINTHDSNGNPVLGELIVSNAQLVRPSGDLAKIFGISESSQLIQFDRSRIYRDRIFTTETVYIMPVGDDPFTLDERANLLWYDRDITTDKSEKITISTINDQQSEAFEVSAGTSVLHSRRTIHGFRQRVLEYRSGYIHMGSDLHFVIGSPKL